MKNSITNGVSTRIRTIITILFLLIGLKLNFIGIFGIIIMWVWTKWPLWLKVLITSTLGLFFSLFLFLSVGFFSYLFFIRPVQMNGNAMAPNFNNGTYLISNVVRPSNIAVNRGDVIIFKSPINSDLESIKRVIGMPGETVEIKSGEIYINGQKLDESKYLSSDVKTYGGAFLIEEQVINIPTGQYFMLGDNRSDSIDSRDWGLISQENIISKVAFCYWGCDNK